MFRFFDFGFLLDRTGGAIFLGGSFKGSPPRKNHRSLGTLANPNPGGGGRFLHEENSDLQDCDPIKRGMGWRWTNQDAAGGSPLPAPAYHTLAGHALTVTAFWGGGQASI